jgi:hypothetical protein
MRKGLSFNCKPTARLSAAKYCLRKNSLRRPLLHLKPLPDLSFNVNACGPGSLPRGMILMKRGSRNAIRHVYPVTSPCPIEAIQESLEHTRQVGCTMPRPAAVYTVHETLLLYPGGCVGAAARSWWSDQGMSLVARRRPDEQQRSPGAAVCTGQGT